MFTREDWTLFRSLGTLGQKAGVPLRRLAALVVKELVDNALDAGATAQVESDGDWIYVVDDGTGLPGDAAAIASLFSIKRPLTSSKMCEYLPAARWATAYGLSPAPCWRLVAACSSKPEASTSTSRHAMTAAPTSR